MIGALTCCYSSSNGDWGGLRGGLFPAVGVGGRVSGEVLGVVDDSNEQGTARAAGDLLSEAEFLLGDLEKVAAGAWVGEGLQLLAPLHVLDLHLVVRHDLDPISKRSPLEKT